SLVGTVVASIAAIFISLRVAKISDDQRRIQEATVLPQISVRYEESEYNAPASDLVVQNLGGPLNHLQVDYRSFVTARLHARSAADTVFGFLPLSGFFGPMRLTGQWQGVVARTSTDDGSPNFYFEEGLRGPGFGDTIVAVLPGTVYHLIHLSYQDLLGKNHDR